MALNKPRLGVSTPQSSNRDSIIQDGLASNNVPCILLPEDEMWDQAAFGSSPPRLTASQWMTDLLRNSFKLTSSSDGEEREHASPGRDTNIRVSQWMDGYLNSSNDGLSVLLNTPPPYVTLPGARELETLPVGWEIRHTETGQRYYVNSITQERTWNRPTCNNLQVPAA